MQMHHTGQAYYVSYASMKHHHFQLFKHGVEVWEFVGDKMVKSDCQQPSGDIWQRRGALYLKVLFLLTVGPISTLQQSSTFATAQGCSAYATSDLVGSHNPARGP